MRRLFVLFLILAAVFPLAAQDESFSAMSLNGATGIYVVPTARIGFPDANMGLNGGYHTNFFDPPNGDLKMNHMIQANFSFLKMFELSGTFDLQPQDDDNDILAGIKFQLPFGTVPIAVGSNLQYHDMGADIDHFAAQFYGAVTYSSEIFSWPAETSLLLGYTYFEGERHSNIDFGMGFDLIVLPKYLGNFVHLLIDFANYSYSASPWGTDAWGRGVLNTGIRVDLSQIPALEKLNIAVDVFLADAFDSSKAGSGRSFGVGISASLLTVSSAGTGE
jgi:hypothetical protein